MLLKVQLEEQICVFKADQTDQVCNTLNNCGMVQMILRSTVENLQE